MSRSTENRPDMGTSYSTLLVFLTVAILAAVAYFPSLSNGFVWDDRQLIVENHRLTAPHAVRDAFRNDFWEVGEEVGDSDYYRPLITLTYIFDRKMHGLNPRGYHATNLVIHALGTGLLFLLLVALGMCRWVSGGAALLFGVHPALAESVAWISGRTDSLAALFVLACLLADQKRSNPVWRILSLVFLAAALFSKEASFIAPVAAVVIQWSKGSSPRREAEKRWDMWLILGLYLVLRYLVLGSPAATEAHTLGGLAWATRLVSLPHLAGLLILPFRSRFEYGLGLPPQPLLLGAVGGLILISVLTWQAIRERRSDSHRNLNHVSTLLVLGLLAFAPALAAATIKAVVADRLLYLPAVFLVPAMVAVLNRWLPARALVVSVAILVIAAGAMSAGRCRLWTSDRTLFEAAAAAPHPSARVHLNLGIAYHDEGLLLESHRELESTLKQATLKTAHYTLGLLYTEIGCEARALAHYEASVRLDPGYAPAANNLGALLAELGRAGDAEQVLAAALDKSRGNKTEIQVNLDMVRLEQRAPEEEAREPASCGDAQEIARMLQDHRFLNRRALDRLQRRQLEQAEILIRASLHRQPGFLAARLNLVQWHVLKGERSEAREVVEGILRDDPANADAQRLLSYIESNF